MAKQSKRSEMVKLVSNLPSKQLESVFTGLTYVFAVLLIVFAVVPTIQTIFSINKEIKEKERVYKALEDKLVALSSLDEEYNDKSEEFKNLSLLFPSTGNFSLFLSNIDAVVSRNNFILDSISFSEYDRETYNVKSAALKPWSVRISVSGKKVYFVTLLRDLEAMPMYPVIENVSYSSEVDDNGNVRYSIGLRIYHIENSKFYD
ncbi:MAG: hypothetical protein ACOX0X_01660 [Candidatus Dojkabacteria bacterium]